MKIKVIFYIIDELIGGKNLFFYMVINNDIGVYWSIFQEFILVLVSFFCIRFLMCQVIVVKGQLIWRKYILGGRVICVFKVNFFNFFL